MYREMRSGVGSVGGKPRGQRDGERRRFPSLTGGSLGEPKRCAGSVTGGEMSAAWVHMSVR